MKIDERDVAGTLHSENNFVQKSATSQVEMA